MYDQVTIFSLQPTTPQTSIHFEGEALFPYRLLADDDGGGVEFRSVYTCEYRAVSEEARSTHADLAGRVDRCLRLLRELSVALNNSEAAQLAHAESEEPDLHTLGAISIEQVRIKKEIASQQATLIQLEEESDRARQDFADPMKVYHCRTTLTLPFGRTKVGDHTYHLQATALHGAAIAGEATPRLHWE